MVEGLVGSPCFHHPRFNEVPSMQTQLGRKPNHLFPRKSVHSDPLRPMSFTIFIIDNDPLAGHSLGRLMESNGRTVEVFHSAWEFLEAYDPARPGCLICDVHMAGISAIALQSRLREMGSGIPIIIISGRGDIATAVLAIKAGAADFLEKPVSEPVLLSAVERAIAQEEASREESRERARFERQIGRLTRREREVMALVVEGLSSKAIAARLGVSFKTIESHRAKVMRKMQAKSVPQLIHMRLRHGMNGAGRENRGLRIED